MPRPQDQARHACAIASVFATILASATGALAQNAGAPAMPAAQAAGAKDCAKAPPAPDPASVLSTQRGWQMMGQNLDLELTSSKVTDKSRLVVCFSWPVPGGKGEVQQAEPVRIIQRPTANQPALTLAVRVPTFNTWPPRGEVPYTDDNAAPFADVRILAFDGDTPTDVAMTSVAVVKPNDFCNVPKLGTRVDSGTIEPSASKAWQPVGGEIQFSVESSKPIPNDSLIHICFRWKLNKGDPGPFVTEGAPVRVLEWQSQQPNTIKLGVTVPSIGQEPNRLNGEKVGAFAIPYLLVPKTDVRVLFFDPNLNVLIDGWTWAGITNVFLAALIAIATVGIVFFGLWRVSRRRFPTFGRHDPLLALITTRSGFASLSQFQIMLWTFVVIASAAYVIALSGDLIPITTGTLVLLGISGTAAVIAKAKSESDASAAPPPLDQADAAAEMTRAQYDLDAAQKALAKAAPDQKDDAQNAVYEANAKLAAANAKMGAAKAQAEAAMLRAAVANASDKAAAEAAAQQAETGAENKRTDFAVLDAKAAALTRVRHPRWSDLVMEEIQGRELDVTRVQMLYFTLVTAVFVALKVITSYEIPAIPEGFLILMGISNSVYVGSKFATNPNAKP